MDLLDILGVTLGGGGQPVPGAFSADVLQGFLEWVQARIIAEFPLSTLSVASTDVKIRKWPWDSEKGVYHGITIHPVNDILGVGSCVEDNIGYGVGLTYAIHTDKGDYAYTRLATFRAHVRANFNHRKPSSLTNYWKVTVEPGSFAVPKKYQSSYDVTSEVIRGWSEEERNH